LNLAESFVEALYCVGYSPLLLLTLGTTVPSRVNDIEERVSNSAMGHQKNEILDIKFLYMIQVFIEQVNTLVSLTLKSTLKVNACIPTLHNGIL